jgi:hypothetical protein
MKKGLRITLWVLLALVVVLVVAFNLYADRAIKWGIEKAGASALKVKVGLDKANLSILGGSLGLRNLVISNPEAYQNKTFLQLKNGSVKVRTSTLLSGTIRISEIKLEGISVVLEQRGVVSNNIQDILKNLPADDKTEKTEGKKLHIDSLEMTDISVSVKVLPVPGKPDTVSLKLPPIKMKDLGSDGKMTTSALVSKIIVAISAGIAENGAGLIPDDIIKPLNGTLKNLGQLSGQLLKESKDVSEGLLKTGKGLGESLQGIVNPKKDEKK